MVFFFVQCSLKFNHPWDHTICHWEQAGNVMLLISLDCRRSPDWLKMKEPGVCGGEA